MTWKAFRSHLTPDHEHQTGLEPALVDVDKAGVESHCQSSKVLRGSLREDFRERRVESCRGTAPAVVEEEKTSNILRKKKTENVVRKRGKEEEGR